MNASTRPDQFTSIVESLRVPCERSRRPRPYPHCGGMNPAEWILWFRCGCPPTYVLYCTRCKDAVLAKHELVCLGCNICVPPSDMYSLIEPLDRAA